MADPLVPGVNLITASSPQVATILDGIIHLHAGCILHDNTLATFVLPLSHAQMTQWWQARLDEVAPGDRHIIVYLSKVQDRTTNPGQPAPWTTEGKDWPTFQSGGTTLEVSGVVSLSTPFSQTGPFRALVQKLFVHPCHRRKGIAKSILSKLEAVAMEHGRWNLMLDTTVGTAAEDVYPKLHYERLGVVREYGYSPKDPSVLMDEVWFWKDLRNMKRLE
jgi:GNAT superfamily N-acetyltransferase